MTAPIETPATTPAPRATPRTWVGLAVLVLPLILIAVDSMVLVFALPAISTELSPSGAEQLWIMDIYSFMLAGLLITMSSVGDRIGRRKLLLIGAVAFSAASVLGAVSTSPEMLIAARALLGLAGATLMPSTLSLIRNMFLDRDQRRFAVAVWSAGASAGAAAGPIVGGWIIEHFSWHAAFLMNIPVMVLLLVLAPFFIPESRNLGHAGVDLVSSVQSLVTMVAFVYAIKALAEGENLALAAAGFVVSFAAGTLFVRRQLRMPQPMINVRLFRVKAFTGAVIGDLISIFALIGSLFALTQYLQLVLELSPVESALWLLPQMVVSAASGFFAAWVVRKLPTALLVSLGTLAAAGGFFALIGLSTTTDPLMIALALCLIALGVGIATTLTHDIIMSSVPAERSGQAAAISETAYELGTALGTAVLGSVLLVAYRTGLEGSASGLVSGTMLDRATTTLAEALTVSRELGGELGATFAELARVAYTDGLVLIGIVGAILLVLGAVFMGWMLRGVSSQADLSHHDADH
ncbi:MFS transporter [Salinibacterium sp. ZJ70]|uniref:MFS transporter n=1 Tax=Salinibacterium sp. ZJ70 TaxID=2708084 RepID=UPI00141F3885|nr:MFS transporter [Salinibacterium sp. ZJ70]